MLNNRFRENIIEGPTNELAAEPPMEVPLNFSNVHQSNSQQQNIAAQHLFNHNLPTHLAHQSNHTFPQATLPSVVSHDEYDRQQQQAQTSTNVFMDNQPSLSLPTTSANFGLNNVATKSQSKRKRPSGDELTNSAAFNPVNAFLQNWLANVASGCPLPPYQQQENPAENMAIGNQGHHSYSAEMTEVLRGGKFVGIVKLN